MEPGGSAVVTGASRGIGRAVAEALAARGFDVVATMRNPDDGAGLEGGAAAGTIRVEGLDVTNPAGFEMPTDLRVIVNNAAVEGEYLPIEHADLDQWRRMFETNVFGLLAVTRLALPVLRANGGGVVCNVTSSSILAPVPFYAAYRASKAAVSALGESLRAEVGPHGIRVVEIMPGPIDTDMLAGSDRAPEAMEYEPYRDLGQRAWDARKGADAMTTSPEVAAQSIVDAICDDDGPLRHGCDDLSRGMLDGWRAASDEDMATGMLDAYGAQLRRGGTG